MNDNNVISQNDYEKGILEEARSGIWLDTTDQLINEMREACGWEGKRTELCKMTYDGEHITLLQMDFYEGDTYPDGVMRITAPHRILTITDEDILTIRIKLMKGIEVASFDLKFADPDNQLEREIIASMEEALKELKENQPAARPAVIRMKFPKQEERQQ